MTYKSKLLSLTKWSSFLWFCSNCVRLTFSGLELWICSFFFSFFLQSGFKDKGTSLSIHYSFMARARMRNWQTDTKIVHCSFCSYFSGKVSHVSKPKINWVEKYTISIGDRQIDFVYVMKYRICQKYFLLKMQTSSRQKIAL